MNGQNQGAVDSLYWCKYHRLFFVCVRNAEWLLRLPMTKAVVKTMDAVEMYINKTKGNNIQHWAVAGASKRGWTTWTTAAVSRRCTFDQSNHTANTQLYKVLTAEKTKVETTFLEYIVWFLYLVCRSFECTTTMPITHQCSMCLMGGLSL